MALKRTAAGPPVDPRILVQRLLRRYRDELATLRLRFANYWETRRMNGELSRDEAVAGELNAEQWIYREAYDRMLPAARQEVARRTSPWTVTEGPQRPYSDATEDVARDPRERAARALAVCYALKNWLPDADLMPQRRERTN